VAPVLLNHIGEHRSRAGLMLQVIYRIVDLTVVTLILSALT
jgi:hypothetical protein